MEATATFVLALGLLAPAAEPAAPPGPDLAQLREMLNDRQHPRGQSQAALCLVQARGPEAEKIVREALRHTEDGETFLALAAAVRLCQDPRFTDELFTALQVSRAGVRAAAGDALAAAADPATLPRLQKLADDAKAETGVRVAALGALARTGRKGAVPPLLDHLAGDNDALKTAAAEGLAELSGQGYGSDLAGWRAWWDRHKDLSDERWLEQRLAFQAGRARRLEGDLERARAQAVRLHQQLYSRLHVADRLAYVQAQLDQEDAAVRALAVRWVVELLPTADAPRQKQLGQMLLRLSQDGAPEVQRSAVLALGRVPDPASLDRLTELLRKGPPPVRAAAARSLAALARGTDAEARERQKVVIPALQKALDDPALEVVVEVAEDLGTLGAREANPVLTGLLAHPSEHVRQTAAQALERVADAGVLDKLLAALGDGNGSVRFSLVGAVARAAGDGAGLGEAQRRAVVERLEGLLARDPDMGVRSRAATVLGECGPPSLLPALWRAVQTGEDARVQEKAWAAFVEVVARAADAALLKDWDRQLAGEKQHGRRVQLLGEASQRWLKRPETRALAEQAQELLVPAYLDGGKWLPAAPLVRDLLGRPGTEAELAQRLKWLLTSGELALKEGNKAEAQRACQDAQAYLPRSGPLAEAFDKLAKDSGWK